MSLLGLFDRPFGHQELAVTDNSRTSLNDGISIVGVYTSKVVLISHLETI